jgi:hypothetical protein
MPTLGNLVVWRSIYEHDQRIYCDAIRLSPFDGPRVRKGGSIEVFSIEMLPAGAPERVRSIVDRFSRFAQNSVAVVRTNPLVLGDARYAPAAESTDPLWGLTIIPGNPHPEYTTIELSTFFDARREAIAAQWQGIWSDEGYLPVTTTTPAAPPASPAPAIAPD